MKIITTKNLNELKQDLIENKKKLTSMKFLHSGRQLKNTSEIKSVKRSIACILTAIKSKETYNNA